MFTGYTFMSVTKKTDIINRSQMRQGSTLKHHCKTHLQKVHKSGEQLWSGTGDVSDTLTILNHHFDQHQNCSEDSKKDNTNNN